MAPSDNGFQQMSFVNSIATTKGGRHVEHVAKLMETALIETIKKKNKSGVQIKPHQVATLGNVTDLYDWNYVLLSLVLCLDYRRRRL